MMKMLFKLTCCWHQFFLKTFSECWFNIVYSLYLYTSWRLISMRIISDEIQHQARKWPTSTQSLQRRYTLLITAVQWTDCCPTKYFHSCAPIWFSTLFTTVLAMRSMLYSLAMRSMLNDRDRPTSSIYCIFCIFCIFEILTSWGTRTPQLVRISNLLFNHYVKLMVCIFCMLWIVWILCLLYNVCTRKDSPLKDVPFLNLPTMATNII